MTNDVFSLLNDNIQRLSKSMVALNVTIDKDELWDVYLNAFRPGTNPVYRERTVHDCQCCKHFLRRIGCVVFVDNEYNLHTIFEMETGEDVYQPVFNALDAYVRSCPIEHVFLTNETNIGTRSNRELDGSKVITYHHYFCEVPHKYVARSYDLNEKFGQSRDSKHVFERSLEEITPDAVDTVLELISSNSLYRGDQWKNDLRVFRQCQKDYADMPDDKKQNYLWYTSVKLSPTVSRIRNHSIGVLLQNISGGMDLDNAVRAYESIVAPANYKRPKPVYTKRMLEQAQKQIEDMGYMDSLGRRFAEMDDITVNNILFANRETRKALTKNVFESMAEEIPADPKKFSRVEEITIDKFINDVLPAATSIEAFVEKKHEPNFVSLIAPQDRDAKSMFKWSNGFSWAYNGNLADSDIRRNVKAAGGNVNGVLRFSIQWNDGKDWDQNDLDAHCFTPGNEHIYYRDKKDYITRGELDVDIIQPVENKPAVENITWPSLSSMTNGVYTFFVRCYTNKNGKSGFRAEIEANGEVHKYNYTSPVSGGQPINVANVKLENGKFTIIDRLPSSTSSVQIWNVSTNHFVPVTMIMKSPNYWDDQHGIGNLHYMFMLKDCKNPDCPNGFYNEYLNNEMMANRKVFEALGSRMTVGPSDNQLSGLGFSSTMRNELIVRVTGTTSRIMKIKF